MCLATIDRILNPVPGCRCTGMPNYTVWLAAVSLSGFQISLHDYASKLGHDVVPSNADQDVVSLQRSLWSRLAVGVDVNFFHPPHHVLILVASDSPRMQASVIIVQNRAAISVRFCDCCDFLIHALTSAQDLIFVVINIALLSLTRPDRRGRHRPQSLVSH